MEKRSFASCLPSLSLARSFSVLYPTSSGFPYWLKTSSSSGIRCQTGTPRHPEPHGLNSSRILCLFLLKQPFLGPGSMCNKYVYEKIENNIKCNFKVPEMFEKQHTNVLAHGNSLNHENKSYRGSEEFSKMTALITLLPTLFFTNPFLWCIKFYLSCKNECLVAISMKKKTFLKIPGKWHGSILHSTAHTLYLLHPGIVRQYPYQLYTSDLEQ